MQIGCNTLYPAGRLGPEEMFTLPHQLRALDIIAEAGFEGVEYSHTAQLPAADLVRVLEHTRSLGLLPWSVHAWTALAAAEGQVGDVLRQWREAAAIARALEVRVVVVHSSGGMQPEGLAARRRANTETLVALAELVAPETTVAVENMDSRADFEFIVDMVSRCPAQNVGVNIDTGHAHLGDLSVVEAIRLGGNLIRTTHLQDNRGRQDDHLPPGQGTIAWPEALAAFREVGYSGVYMVEISDCPPDREPDAVADTNAAARNLRRFLAQLP
jgi:sugar phosphate isomerase/epimerase